MDKILGVKTRGISTMGEKPDFFTEKESAIATE
jgi:hypothetical protein